MASEPEKTTTSADDEKRHQSVIGRVQRWQLIAAAIGLPAWLILGGQREAISFAVGAVVSIASFGLLDKFTSVVGGGPTSRSSLAFSAMRIFLVGGFLFVIMSNYSLHPLAVATGLLTTVAAITVEALVGSLLCMNLG